MTLSIQVDWLLQPGTKPAADRRPALPLAVVGDQTVSLGRGVELLFGVLLVERAGRDPSAERPCGSVQRSISPARTLRLEVADHLVEVRLASALVGVRGLTRPPRRW